MSDNNTFEVWKQQVDKLVVAECGLSCDDLPDAPYQQWYEQGVQPASAASRTLRLAKEY